MKAEITTDLLKDLVGVQEQSVSKLAVEAGIKQQNLSGYLAKRSYLSDQARERLENVLGLTTQGQFSSRRVYVWHLGDSLEPARRLLHFIFEAATGSKGAFEAKIILNEFDDMPIDDVRGQCKAYAVRGIGFRAKLFRLRHSNVDEFQSFDPVGLGGAWHIGQGADVVRLNEVEWESWCQSTSVKDFDAVFSRNSSPDFLDVERAIRDRGWSIRDAMSYMNAREARQKLVANSNSHSKAEGGGK